MQEEVCRETPKRVLCLFFFFLFHTSSCQAITVLNIMPPSKQKNCNANIHTPSPVQTMWYFTGHKMLQQNAIAQLFWRSNTNIVKMSFSLSGNSVTPGEVMIYNCRAAAKACCINGPIRRLLSPTEVYVMQQDRTPKTGCSCLNAACSCTCGKTDFNGPQRFSRGMKTTKTTFLNVLLIKKIKIMTQQKEFL